MWMRVLGLSVHVGSGPASQQNARPTPAPSAGPAEPGQSSGADLEVAMIGDRPWPEGLAHPNPRLSYVSPETDEHGTPIVTVSQHGDDRFCLRYWDGSEFMVDRPGTRVWARWPPAVPPGEIEMCLLGPIIGFVLHLRGTPCLHASAVAIDGRAIAFLGHSGAGKSTTAAAFVTAGWPALTDDVLALDEEGGWTTGRNGERRTENGERGGETGGNGERRFLVRPGHNLVRLWPDAVRALYGSEDALPRGADDKHQLDLAARAGGFHAAPLPLAAIYVLEGRRPDLPAPAVITELKGHAALMALVARTYMNYVLDTALRADALHFFSRLAAAVPIRQLAIRHDASELHAVRDRVLQDFRQSTESTKSK